MSENVLGPEALLGQLRDAGWSATIVNRIGELLKMFGNNIPQFCALTRGRLEKAYNDANPPKSELEAKKGLGAKTYAAFDAFVRLYKQSLCDAKQIAKAAAEEQERKEAERASMRLELLDREVDFDAMTAAMAALGTLGMKTCTIGKLLEMHDMAKGAKA